MGTRTTDWGPLGVRGVPLSCYEEWAKARPPRTRWERIKDDPGLVLSVAFTVAVVVTRITLEIIR